MRAYESGAARDHASTRLAIGISDGPYRLRSANAVTWPSQGYGQPAGFGRKLADAARAILRTVIPVLTLCAALAAMYLYMNTPVPYLSDHVGHWLMVSHLLLPMSFLAIHLTNRRYGPAYAFAQIVLSYAVLLAAILFGDNLIQLLLPEKALLSVRDVAAFGAAFFVSGFLAIVAFDGARGPRWWMAPLVGSVVGVLSFAPLFYLAAYAGTSAPWFEHMAIHAGLLAGGAVLSLIPYWLLRRLVQPLPGYGGY